MEIQLPDTSAPNCQLSETQRGAVIMAYAFTESYAETARIVGLPRSTVYYIIKHVKTTGSTAPKARTGRPRASTERMDRIICREARNSPHSTLGELSVNLVQNYAIPLHINTLKSRLQEQNIQKWRAKRRPELLPRHAAQRLQWALARRHWQYDDWARIIWSDECWIQRTGDPRTAWVFRTTNEKWRRDLVVPYVGQGDAKVMIWAMFIGETKGPLYMVEGNFDSTKYLEVLQEHLPQFMHDNRRIGANWTEDQWPTFMHDNAKPHVAKIVTEWFADTETSLLPWCPYSPDLNPIEHVWWLLKDQAWAAIPEDYLRRLVESMNDRIDAVIAAKGWYTRF
ncbi:hypothetical protein TWF694_011914 [Orbilia ellipsospora]|uniref:Transposase n=1 Tax=Orbilia ellipsospora TaxID=2528407 RepID=A0AAV9X5V1_9PEZI